MRLPGVAVEGDGGGWSFEGSCSSFSSSSSSYSSISSSSSSASSSSSSSSLATCFSHGSRSSVICGDALGNVRISSGSLYEDRRSELVGKRGYHFEEFRPLVFGQGPGGGRRAVRRRDRQNESTRCRFAGGTIDSIVLVRVYQIKGTTKRQKVREEILVD